ncbi:MAG: tRNA lysidine(34) synthetase TilS, partial [Lachnospiraceae bacterium]|nr:tRNA lysidine(34) synthetase TilS [Lachnospiraceae bacterium]
VIRPLLCVDRTEIEQWLSEKGISYCADSTNEQDAYTRNRIRHHILPYAEQEICHGAVAHMNRTADELMMAEEYLKRETEKAVERCVLQGEGAIQIRIPDFLLEDEYLKGRILLYCIEKAAGSRKDISWVHVMAIKRLFQTNGSKEIDLPYRLKVYKQYDLGMIQKCGEKSGNGKVYLVVPPGQVDIPGLGRVEFTVFPMDKSQNIPEKTYTKWFDYDKILSSMKFRARHKGDYLTVKGSSGRIGHKLLQDYFVNEKIPREERDRVYILAEGSHVLWIPGRRISEYYKIDEKTQTILQVVVVDKKE